MKPCKHGHIDGALHKPCYQCRCESLEAELSVHWDRMNNDDLIHCFKHGTASAFGGWVCPICVEVGHLHVELAQAQDMLSDSVSLIDLIATALSVDAEPHQTFNARLLEAAQQEVQTCDWTQVDTETARSECGYEVMHERGTEFPNYCYECGRKINGLPG